MKNNRYIFALVLIFVVGTILVFSLNRTNYTEITTNCDSRIMSGELVYKEDWEFLDGDINFDGIQLTVCTEVGIY